MNCLISDLFPDPKALGTPLAQYARLSEIKSEVQIKIHEIGKKTIYISAWRIFQVLLPKEQNDVIVNSGLYPIFVYSEAVIEGRFTVRSFSRWKKSSFLQTFHLNCLQPTSSVMRGRLYMSLWSQRPFIRDY